MYKIDEEISFSFKLHIRKMKVNGSTSSFKIKNKIKMKVYFKVQAKPWKQGCLSNGSSQK